jgi:hypothetical protein
MTAAKGRAATGLIQRVYWIRKQRPDTFNLCNYFGIKRNRFDQYFLYRFVVLTCVFGSDFTPNGHGKCLKLGKY